MFVRKLKKLKNPKELVLLVAQMGMRLFAISPFVVGTGLLVLGVHLYDNHLENVKTEQLRPRVTQSQQLTNQMVENGMHICDPARQRKNAAAELNAALNRLMFIRPEKISNKIDMQNVTNTADMQWATSHGVKICTDTQMDSKTAVMWFPKEKLLAVNGHYDPNLLSLHMRMAIHELKERGTYGHNFGNAEERFQLDHNRPLTEKFAISVRTVSPATRMVISKPEMSRSQIAQKAPIRTGPKNGS